MIDQQTPALESVADFIKTHPGVELEITDRKGEKGNLTVGIDGALHADFRDASLVVNRHGGEFTLTQESIVTIQDSVGLKVLAAARLATETNPFGSTRRKPLLNEPLTGYDPLKEGITLELRGALAHVIRRFPNFELEVEDTATHETGRLCIGKNETVQAEFGKDAFAVEGNTGRFKLTAKGIEAFGRAQAEIEQEALRASERENHHAPREYVVGAVEAVRQGQKEKLLQDFEEKLKHALISGDVFANKTFMAISRVDRTQIQELRKAAMSAGFRVENYNNKASRRNILAISGDEVADILNDVLLQQFYGGELRTLKSYDPEEVGAYALLFDTTGEQLIIINKDLFLHPKS